MDEKHERILGDLDWHLKLLNALCGEQEQWSVPKARKVHECEFGHRISKGTRYLRKLFGPDRSEDAKLCEDCGVRLLHLLFGTGGGTAELATRLLRKQYGSLLVAMRQMDEGRGDTRRQTILPERELRPASSTESARMPKWSAERLADMRRRYPRAYEKWSPGEDDKLKSLFQAGAGAEQIARDLQRQPSAISSRLSRLGLASSGEGCVQTPPSDVRNRQSHPPAAD